MGSHIGVGIIGTGFGALVQLPGFLAIPGARVIGITAQDPDRSAALAAAHGLPQTFPSAEALIAHPDVHLVSVTTPPLHHLSLVQQAIAAGKHVLCEKPFTLGGAAAQSLLTLAQDAGIVHGVDFEFRELQALQLLHDKLLSGAVGAVRSARLSWVVGTWADPARAWSWQCDCEHGGGVLGALGVHLFDIAEWLFGSVKEIRAHMDTAITARLDTSGILQRVTSEDTVDIEMLTADNIPVGMVLSNVDLQGDGLTMNVFGDAGTLTLQSLSQDYAKGLRLLQNDKVLYEETPLRAVEAGDPRIPPFQALATRLIRAIHSHDSFIPSFVEGLRSDLLYEAARTSHDTGTWKEVAMPVVSGHGAVDIPYVSP